MVEERRLGSVLPERVEERLGSQFNCGQELLLSVRETTKTGTMVHEWQTLSRLHRGKERINLSAIKSHRGGEATAGLCQGRRGGGGGSNVLNTARVQPGAVKTTTIRRTSLKPLRKNKGGEKEGSEGKEGGGTFFRPDLT